MRLRGLCTCTCFSHPGEAEDASRGLARVTGTTVLGGCEINPITCAASRCGRQKSRRAKPVDIVTPNNKFPLSLVSLSEVPTAVGLTSESLPTRVRGARAVRPAARIWVNDHAHSARAGMLVGGNFTSADDTT